jgi:hypothetical protein
VRYVWGGHWEGAGRHAASKTDERPTLRAGIPGGTRRRIHYALIIPMIIQSIELHPSGLDRMDALPD